MSGNQQPMLLPRASLLCKWAATASSTEVPSPLSSDPAEHGLPQLSRSAQDTDRPGHPDWDTEQTTFKSRGPKVTSAWWWL